MSAAIANTIASAAVVVRRVIAASAEDLFDAWLDPEAMVQWMRPNKVRRTEVRVEPRVGGRYEILMLIDSGNVLHTGVYRVIDRPRRLVFTWMSGPTENKETLVTVDFVPAGERTEVVVTHELLPVSAMASHNNGWTASLGLLEDLIERGVAK